MSDFKSEIENIEKNYLKKEMPNFQVGNTIEVDLTVREGEKVRVQTFSGIVISRRGKGLNETFTMRKISYGEGVERTFPLHSPVIKEIRVGKKSRVKRAKLYYLREKIGRKGRLKEQKEVKEATAEKK